MGFRVYNGLFKAAGLVKGAGGFTGIRCLSLIPNMSKNTECYFDIGIGGQPAGRIVFQVGPET